MKKTEFLKKVFDEGLIQKSDRILIAISGGADSVSLFRALVEFREELSLELAVVHVNHQLRENAKEDEKFVKALCKKFDVPCFVKKVAVKKHMKETGKSLEESARDLRYEAFYEVISEIGFQKLAVAHHLNDSVETILFQWMRGTGLRGMSGIPKSRTLGETKSKRRYQVIRPLIHLSKKEILTYLRLLKQDYREDESNEEDDVSRNKIRHRILPEMEKMREDVMHKISDSADYFRKLDLYLSKEAIRWLNENARINSKNEVEIPKNEFLKLDPVIQEYGIREAIRSAGFSMKDVTRAHIESVIALFSKEGSKEISLPSDIQARLSYEDVILSSGRKKEEHYDVKEHYSFVARVFSYEKGMKIPDNEFTKWFDYDKINGPLVLRSRKDGDIISTKAGTHKKLNDYFISEKIPKEERDRIPLLAIGKEILWVFHYRMNEEYKVTEKTKNIVGITIFEEEL